MSISTKLNQLFVMTAIDVGGGGNLGPSEIESLLQLNKVQHLITTDVLHKTLYTLRTMELVCCNSRGKYSLTFDGVSELLRLQKEFVELVDSFNNFNDFASIAKIKNTNANSQLASYHQSTSCVTIPYSKGGLIVNGILTEEADFFIGTLAKRRPWYFFDGRGLNPKMDFSQSIALFVNGNQVKYTGVVEYYQTEDKALKLNPQSIIQLSSPILETDLCKALDNPSFKFIRNKQYFTKENDVHSIKELIQKHA